MKAVLCAFLICGAAAGSVSPVQKVMQLLGELEGKITRQGEAEQKAFEEFSAWCKGSAQDKGFEIKTAKSHMEELTATIGKAESDRSATSSTIEDMAASISQNDADLKAASDIRAKENEEFLKNEAELVDTVDVLDRAINILERKMKGAALVQARINTQDITALVQALTAVTDAAALSLHDSQRLVALAQNRADSDSDDEDEGAPAAAAYKSKSENIVDVLEDLREKAESQLAEARKEEVSAAHNFAMLKQSLEDQIAADKKEMGEAKSAKAAAAETQAIAEGDLVVTSKDLADAENALQVMTGDCTTQGADHEASVASRAEELKALAAAKKALTENTGAAAGSTYAEGASLLQVDSLTSRADLANFEVVNLVRELAKKEHSSNLMQLAGRIATTIRYGARAGEDPFAKVKAMISDMVSKLEEEAGADATQKAYCDKEMGDTKTKIEDLTASVDGLTAKIDKAKASSVTLKGDVKDLQAELAKLTKSQAEMDEVRKGEHAAFVQGKSELEQGLDGVRMALKVLREYYAADADAASALLQQPATPGTHEKAAGAGSGIIGMLEVVESDFGNGLAQAEVAEDSAATDYQKISQMNKITKATKESDVKYKSKEAASLDKTVSELSSDLGGQQTELDAVLEYSASIRNQCVAKPDTYEERKGRRTAEVEGLKEALRILDGEALLQQGKKAPTGLRLVAAHRD